MSDNIFPLANVAFKTNTIEICPESLLRLCTDRHRHAIMAAYKEISIIGKKVKNGDYCML